MKVNSSGFKWLINLIFVALIASCGSKKVAVQKPPERSKGLANSERQLERSAAENMVRVEPVTPSRFNNKVEVYIHKYAPIAQQEMRLYGIPASITLAQGILESNSGKSQLTTRSNNHFGIKCNGWQGQKVYHDDDRKDECFRAYSRAHYSFRDHSLFLFQRSRYRFLFDYDMDDFRSWAKGLKKAGYATDRRYPNKLIKLIKDFNLDQYDKSVMQGNFKPKKSKNIDKPKQYTVKKGDTLYSIGKKYNVSVDELKQLNQLQSNNIEIGQKLYLEPVN